MSEHEQPLIDVESEEELTEEELVQAAKGLGPLIERASQEPSRPSSSSNEPPEPGGGVLEQILRNHPGLTREEALEMAENFGF